jgi:arylsulfatase A-like enzyme
LDVGHVAIRADRIARMQAVGLLDPESTVFPRLPEIPAWEDLTADERRAEARRMELFAAMVEHMDANIGKLVGYLKAKGLYDDTVIVFLSDNGPEGTAFAVGPPWDNSDPSTWGDRGTFIQYGPTWAQVGAGPLRLFKGYLSEGGIRTPLIVAGPEVRGSGRISDAVVHVTDVPATLLAMAGVEPPAIHKGRPVAPIEGKSPAPVLDGTATTVRTPDDWTGWELIGNRAIRQGDWKLLWICAPSGPGQWQLYSLASDPGETTDLAARMPERVAELEGHWEDYVARTGVVLPDESPVCAAPE